MRGGISAQTILTREVPQRQGAVAPESVHHSGCSSGTWCGRERSPLPVPPPRGYLSMSVYSDGSPHPLRRCPRGGGGGPQERITSILHSRNTIEWKISAWVAAGAVAPGSVQRIKKMKSRIEKRRREDPGHPDFSTSSRRRTGCPAASPGGAGTCRRLTRSRWPAGFPGPSASSPRKG